MKWTIVALLGTWGILGYMTVGCVANPSPTHLVTPLPTSTSTPMVDAFTPSPTTFQLELTPTLFLTDTATPSTISTLSSDEILSLLKTNGDCQLPCWFDIVPGKTQFDFVKTVMAELGGREGFGPDNGNSEGSFLFTVPAKDRQPGMEVTYGLIKNGNSYGQTVEWLNAAPLSVYKNDIGEYTIGDRQNYPWYNDDYSAYLIKNILATYGKPDIILLSGDMSGEAGPPWLYALTLVYPKKGIWVEYFGKMGGEPNFKAYPMQASVSLWLWEPEKYSSVDEVRSFIPVRGWGTMLGKVYSLEEQTDLTIDEFYETFKNADDNTCFESPVERWIPKP